MFDWIAGVIIRLGYVGVATLTFLENLFPPIPSELVIPLAGYVAAGGELQAVPVIAAATVGSLAGTTVWYALGRRIGEARLRTWVDRHGRWLTLDGSDLDRAQSWFQRHGKLAVFFGRLIPGIRTFISLPAGFAGMSILPFVLYSAAGTAIWTAALAYGGVVLRANFTTIGDYVNIGTNVVLGMIALLVVRRYLKCWRGKPS
jgi:membrane protein DedA with SNARE-associated domain